MTFGGKVCLFKLQKGSKIYLLSKMYIFSENIQKSKIFKKSKKNLLVSKMEQNPFSCSIGIWNYHLTPSKSESRIFLWPYASPLWSESLSAGKKHKFLTIEMEFWLCTKSQWKTQEFTFALQLKTQVCLTKLKLWFSLNMWRHLWPELNLND